MKKFICVFVCLMTMVVSANAQNLLKIKQLALNEFKQSLNAPSQFILTDKYGNRISVSQIPTKYYKAYVSLDTICFYNQDVIKYVCSDYKVLDSIGVRKVHHLAHYAVKITGDGMVLAGGYKQMNEWYYVTPDYKVLEDEPIITENGYTIVRKFGEKDRTEKELELLSLAKNAKENGVLVIGYGKVFDIVEQMPSFPNGMGALMKWIKDNMKYPVIAAENGVQGRAIVRFIVEKDGSLTDVCIAKSADPSLDKEAIRLVESMPKWIPGKSNGSNVRCKYTIPITFKL